MTKFYLLFAVFLFGYAAQSQNSVVLKGKVLDKTTQVPLESATVYLTSAIDSTVIDYTITDKNGAFLINAKKTTKPVFLKISYIGFETFKEAMKTVEADKDFGILRLGDGGNLLGEVNVKGEAPPIRVKQDTLEFNASSFKVRPDSNVETLLKQLPGVEIDADGKITVNGKEVKQVLVNGKPFFDKDGKIALQNLPSDIINKVQITDLKTKKEELTKSAASSNDASINVTIDEDKNKGLFGKFMGGYGTDSRYESSALLNYFKNKRKLSVLASSNNINSTGFSMDEIFDNMGGGRNVSYYFNPADGSYGIGNLRFGGGKGIIKSNMVGINYDDEWFKGFTTNGSYFFSSSNAANVNHTRLVDLLPTGNLTTLSDADTKSESLSHNFSVNFEYKIDSTMTLNVNPKLVVAHARNSGNSNQSTLDAANELLNDNVAQTSETDDKYTFSNTLNFTKSFKRKGRYFSLMLENINSKEDNEAYNKSLTQFYQNTDPDDVRDQNRKNRNVKDSYATELELGQPITDSLKVKVGVYGRWEKSSEDRKTYDFDPVTQTYDDVNEPQTNFFSSSMLILTPKSGFSIQKKKYSVEISAGTTITEMHNDSFYLGNKTDIDKTYIFPYLTAWGSYRFTQSKSLWVSYEYLAAFPSAQELLPIENLSDPLNTYIGNPNLKIDDGHSLNINYNDYDYATRSGYNVYAGGEYYNTQRTPVTTYNESGKRTTTYDNVSGTYNTYMGFHWNKSVRKEANSFRGGFGLRSGIDKAKGYTNGQLFTANSVQATPSVMFTYEYGELLTINPSYSLTYNETNYTNYLITSASNVVHKINLTMTSYWPKNWVFGNDFTYTYNSNIANGFKKDFYLLNSSLAYNFYNKKFTAKVKVYDVLDQNQSSTRTITPTTIRDEENMVLKRYAMFSLTYKIEKFAGKEKLERSRF